VPISQKSHSIFPRRSHDECTDRVLARPGVDSIEAKIVDEATTALASDESPATGRAIRSFVLPPLVMHYVLSIAIMEADINAA
jgi:ethanolamine utilization microcompartment shell protein EutL